MAVSGAFGTIFAISSGVANDPAGPGSFVVGGIVLFALFLVMMPFTINAVRRPYRREGQAAPPLKELARTWRGFRLMIFPIVGCSLLIVAGIIWSLMSAFG